MLVASACLAAGCNPPYDNPVSPPNVPARHVQ